MERKKTLLIRVSFIVSVFLLAVKFYSYFLTHSTAILTDALESIVNVVAAAFATYSIYLSSRPRDDNHPYGHGKIEFFSAGIEGVLIILAGLFIIYQAVYNWFFPVALVNLFEGIVLVTIAGTVNGVLGFILQRQGKKLNSVTLEASGKHLISDALTSFLLILGVVVILLTDLQFLDSVISIVFSLYIIYSGYGLVRRSVAGLMDEADPAAVEATVKVLNENRRHVWIDIHNMRVQQYGGDRHIDLHLTLPNYFNLKQVHDEVHDVEEVLKESWPGVMEVFVHADPCIPEKCCHYCQVEDCAVRIKKNDILVEWNAANMSKNQKHYHDLLH